MDKLIAKYTENITNKLGNDLEALMLVGSFSRGEGIKGISDIEFWAVVKDLAKIKKPQLDKNVSLGFTTRGHLKRLKPYIYTVEVKKFGRVLYGDKNIVSHIPDYSFEDIDPRDGFTLLNNRIIEQLEIRGKIEKGDAISKYEIDKGYLQLVNSLLAVKRKYKGTYPEKREAFAKLLSEDKDVSKIAAKLLPKIEEALSDFNDGYEGNYSKEEALDKWNELRDCMRKAWTFEIASVSSLPRNDDKIKGWTKVLLDSKKRSLFSLSEILSNFFRASPQFLIYQYAASEYFFDTPNAIRAAKIIDQWKKVVK